VTQTKRWTALQQPSDSDIGHPMRFHGFRPTAFVRAAVACVVFSSVAGAQGRVAPDSLTNAEFWAFFTSMSEPDGSFLSENFVSNELSFQDVIPTLQKSLTKNGVYLGVGPEQNFTYISNLSPRLAVIFDIRRQNAMHHLMYKALFELSPTRAEFVSRLFSRPAVARLGTGIGAKELFDSAAVMKPSDSAYKANSAAIFDLLMKKHGFDLPDADMASIRHVYDVFFSAGPDVNYGYRSGSRIYMPSTYPTYGMLQSATNADTVQMAFLSSEEHYRAVRDLQLKNLIVPVVGDFGGPSAIKSVAKWLHDRELRVSAFYVSNVEQYLWREVGAASRFYSNVSALPIDSTSQFIRSVPRMGPMPTFSSTRAVTGPSMRFTITRDANGNVISQTFRDSAGVTLVQTTIDSSGSRRTQTTRDSSGKPLERFTIPRDSTQQPDSLLRRMIAIRDSLSAITAPWQIATSANVQVVMGGTLTSGIASMDKTLKSFFLGELKGYQSIVEMTRVTGWR
jgi:hypothetical protein